MHAEDHTLDIERGVQRLAHKLDGFEELADALQREVVRLHRDEDAVRGGQGVECQQAQCWRAVEDDDVEPVADSVQGFLEPLIAVGRIAEVVLDAG